MSEESRYFINAHLFLKRDISSLNRTLFLCLSLYLSLSLSLSLVPLFARMTFVRRLFHHVTCESWVT